jgi:hypothetical protein
MKSLLPKSDWGVQRKATVSTFLLPFFTSIHLHLSFSGEMEGKCSAVLLIGNKLVCQHIDSKGLTSNTKIPFTCGVRKKVVGVSGKDFKQKEDEKV